MLADQPRSHNESFNPHRRVGRPARPLPLVPNQTMKIQTVPNQTVPNQTMPNQTMPNQTMIAALAAAASRLDFIRSATRPTFSM